MGEDFVWIYAYVSRCPLGSETLNPMELELHVVVSHLLGGLGAHLQSSRRIGISALTHLAISTSSQYISFNH